MAVVVLLGLEQAPATMLGAGAGTSTSTNGTTAEARTLEGSVTRPPVALARTTPVAALARTLEVLVAQVATLEVLVATLATLEGLT